MDCSCGKGYISNLLVYPSLLLGALQNSYSRKPILLCEAMVTFEDLLSDINGFGRFQVMIIVISFIGRFTLPCHFMLNNFIAAIPSHHCDFSFLDDSEQFRNLSQAEKLAVSIPLKDDGTPRSCEMFEQPQYHLLNNSVNITHTGAQGTVPCPNGWLYDNTTFKSTLTSQVMIRSNFYSKQCKILFFLTAFKLDLYNLSLSGTWCVIKEERTRQQLPSSLLE